MQSDELLFQAIKTNQRLYLNRHVVLLYWTSTSFWNDWLWGGKYLGYPSICLSLSLISPEEIRPSNNTQWINIISEVAFIFFMHISSHPLSYLLFRHPDVNNVSFSKLPCCSRKKTWKLDIFFCLLFPPLPYLLQMLSTLVQLKWQKLFFFVFLQAFIHIKISRIYQL